MTKHTIKISYGIGGITLLVAIAATAMLLTPSQKQHYTETSVTRKDLAETVTATGKIAPEQEATLAFDQAAGTVATVNVTVGDSVKKGDVLGSLSGDILRANLEGAKADQLSAETNLSINTQKFADASTTLASTMRDAYLKTESAILGKTDSFFTSAVSMAPMTTLFTDGIPMQNKINAERVAVGNKLSAWKANVTSQPIADDTIGYIKQYLNDISTLTNTMTVNSSGYTQSQIDADRAISNAALTQMTAAETEYIAAKSTLSQSSNQGQAQVQKTIAQVGAIQSQINHTVITAPFDGIIIRVEPKIGEVFAAGMPAFGIMSNGTYKIEIQVPETDVAKVSVGDIANVTLDAYGNDILFPASVTSIDPSQTISSDGISSYKITLHFSNNDSRIRSGMTANASIITKRVQNSLAIPTRAIITRGADTFVLIKNPSSNTFTETKIKAGIKSPDGFSEVVSGLSEGNIVASFGN